MTRTGFRVTLLGTGVPIPSPDRFGPCTWSMEIGGKDVRPHRTGGNCASGDLLSQPTNRALRCAGSRFRRCSLIVKGPIVGSYADALTFAIFLVAQLSAVMAVSSANNCTQASNGGQRFHGHSRSWRIAEAIATWRRRQFLSRSGHPS
jgi:hypothetical protein